LLSLVLPGFGQIYNGEVNKAIWLFLAFGFVNIPVMVAVFLYLPEWITVPTLVLTLFASIGIWVYGMHDAFSGAKQRQDYVPERWQTGGMYTLVFIACNLLALPALVMFVRANLFESFRVPSVSMEPAVMRGDFLTADKRYNCPACKFSIERGDVTVFANPNDRSVLFIKRIIALPGERVQIRGREVIVDGRSLTVAETTNGSSVIVTESSGDGREWQVQWQRLPGEPELDVVVPPGEVFVLGDNRSNSQDSRHIGTVMIQDVIGRARQVWLSIGEDGVRWSRLGELIE
jgi:signal peptidase I